MEFLKKIPITFKGELHDVRLINFTVEADEIRSNIPNPLIPLVHNNRAMISMVDVELKHMRPAFFPDNLHFSYRHVAFRVLIDDREYHNLDEPHGIFFLNSFTNKKRIILGGQWMTKFNLNFALISGDETSLSLKRENKFMEYRINPDFRPDNSPQALEIKSHVAPLDRAYSIIGNSIYVLQIQREEWPIEPVTCDYFNTTFFESAKLEAAFYIKKPISYEWLSPQKITSRLRE